MIRLAVVLDEWARPEPPADEIPAVLSRGEYIISARRSWQLNAMLAARIQVPGPLILVTGC